MGQYLAPGQSLLSGARRSATSRAGVTVRRRRYTSELTQMFLTVTVLVKVAQDPAAVEMLPDH